MSRTFKTKWFAKVATKAGITDMELCLAIAEAEKGQADDLGGGGVKKRLNRNEHRSIVLMKGRARWIYAYLFAKKDRENITPDELVEFRKLAKIYANATEVEIRQLLANQALSEICL